ncbi:CapA family protein [Desulfococcaceae bacterium HSG7]|nr:CapA family protein [Desulfococcaceae bacterium HSG7]
MRIVHFIKSFPFSPSGFYSAFIKYSPYNLKEILGCFIRNSFGLSYKNKGIVKYSPQSFCVNENTIPKFRIAFIGDIMDMAGKNETVSKNIKLFVQNCDYLVGNFEASITAEKKTYGLAQRHSPQIMDALANFFAPDKTFLSLANNHAGDFGYKIFSESVAKLESRGFQIIGVTEKPFAEIGSDIRIVAGTAISNYDCDYIVKMEDAVKHYAPDKFNVLYPHWGYDLELFPRPATVTLAKKIITDFDAIIGHHAHNPQPVTVTNSNKLIAYGLGDFCIWEELKHYLYGMIIKLDIGPNSSGKWQIGQVEWRFTTCREKNSTDWETKIVDTFPYL